MIIRTFTGFLFAATLGACLDFTPLSPPATDAAAAAPDDAGAADASQSEAGSACMGCIAGTSDASAQCENEYAACLAMAKCGPMFLCGLDMNCYAPAANLVACLTTCGERVGLTSQSDPAVPAFIALYTCTTGKCADMCASH